MEVERFLDRYGDVLSSEMERMAQALNLLGVIGPKAKAAVPLLRQIAVLAPPKREGGRPSLDDKFFDAVKETLDKIGDVPATDSKESPILLSEFFRLQSRWNLLAMKPGAKPKDIQFDFNQRIAIQDRNDQANFEVVGKVMDQIGASSSWMHFRINDTVTPRQIELIYKQQGRSQFGIYELTSNGLKIELAKPGLPQPKEFSADQDKLPEGHVVLELEREQSAASTSDTRR